METRVEYTTFQAEITDPLPPLPAAENPHADLLIAAVRKWSEAEANYEWEPFGFTWNELAEARDKLKMIVSRYEGWELGHAG